MSKKSEIKKEVPYIDYKDQPAVKVQRVRIEPDTGGENWATVWHGDEDINLSLDHLKSLHAAIGEAIADYEK